LLTSIIAKTRSYCHTPKQSETTSIGLHVNLIGLTPRYITSDKITQVKYFNITRTYVCLLTARFSLICDIIEPIYINYKWCCKHTAWSWDFYVWSMLSKHGYFTKITFSDFI